MNIDYKHCTCRHGWHLGQNGATPVPQMSIEQPHPDQNFMYILLIVINHGDVQLCIYKSVCAHSLDPHSSIQGYMKSISVDLWFALELLFMNVLNKVDGNLNILWLYQAESGYWNNLFVHL